MGVLQCFILYILESDIILLAWFINRQNAQQVRLQPPNRTDENNTIVYMLERCIELRVQYVRID